MAGKKSTQILRLDLDVTGFASGLDSAIKKGRATVATLENMLNRSFGSKLRIPELAGEKPVLNLKNIAEITKKIATVPVQRALDAIKKENSVLQERSRALNLTRSGIADRYEKMVGSLSEKEKKAFDAYLEAKKAAERKDSLETRKSLKEARLRLSENARNALELKRLNESISASITRTDADIKENAQKEKRLVTGGLSALMSMQREARQKAQDQRYESLLRRRYERTHGGFGSSAGISFQDLKNEDKQRRLEAYRERQSIRPFIFMRETGARWQELGSSNFQRGQSGFYNAMSQWGYVRSAAQSIFNFIKPAIELEHSQSAVNALIHDVLPGAEERAKKLKETTKRLGETTPLTATQVSLAEEELARAGWNTSEVEQIIGGTVRLGLATDVTPEKAAEITSQALYSFGLGKKDINKVSNILVGIANNSPTDISLIKSSMKYGASSARRGGADLTEFGSLLMALARNKIVGSQAGTSLRSIYGELSKDPYGKKTKAYKFLTSKGVLIRDPNTNELRPIANILRDLNRHFKAQKMSNADINAALTAIFGKTASPAASALMDAAVKMELEQYKEILKRGVRENVAALTAEQKTQNLQGELQRLASKWEGLQVQVGDTLAPAIRKDIIDLTHTIGVLIEYVRKNPKEMEKMYTELKYTGGFLTGLIGLGATASLARMGFGGLQWLAGGALRGIGSLLTSNVARLGIAAPVSSVTIAGAADLAVMFAAPIITFLAGWKIGDFINAYAKEKGWWGELARQQKFDKDEKNKRAKREAWWYSSSRVGKEDFNARRSNAVKLGNYAYLLPKGAKEATVSKYGDLVRFNSRLGLPQAQGVLKGYENKTLSPQLRKISEQNLLYQQLLEQYSSKHKIETKDIPQKILMGLKGFAKKTVDERWKDKDIPSLQRKYYLARGRSAAEKAPFDVWGERVRGGGFILTEKSRQDISSKFALLARVNDLTAQYKGEGQAPNEARQNAITQANKDFEAWNVPGFDAKRAEEKIAERFDPAQIAQAIESGAIVGMGNAHIAVAVNAPITQSISANFDISSLDVLAASVSNVIGPQVSIITTNAVKQAWSSLQNQSTKRM